MQGCRFLTSHFMWFRVMGVDSVAACSDCCEPVRPLPQACSAFLRRTMLSPSMNAELARPTPPIQRFLEDEGVVEEYVPLETELGWAIDEVLVKAVRGAYSVQATYKCLEDSERGLWYGPTQWWTRTPFWKPCGVHLTNLTGSTEGYWVQWWNTGAGRWRRERSERHHDQAESDRVQEFRSSESSSGSTRSRSSRRGRRLRRPQEQRQGQRQGQLRSSGSIEADVAAQMAIRLFQGLSLRRDD